MSAPLRLFTYQGYDLRTFAGPIDRSQGTYQNEPPIWNAQGRLYQVLGTDQVVWCSQETSPGPTLRPFFHELDVDWREVVGIIDGLVWNHIIRDDPRYIPPNDRTELRSVAQQHDDYAAARARLEDEYLSRLPKDLWSGLVESQVNDRNDQILVRFLFERTKVTSVVEIMKKPQARERPPRNQSFALFAQTTLRGPK